MDFETFTAKNVSDAITEACTKFSVPSDQLEYEVVEEGSNGFLGFAAKDAIIKARIKGEEKAVSSTEEENDESDEKEENRSVSEIQDNQNDTEVSDEGIKDNNENNEAEEAALEKEETHESKHERKPVNPVSQEHAEELCERAKKFLTDVFHAMDTPVVIETVFDTSENSMDINLSGDDMGVLIGKRGQTLDSMQYLVSLVVNKGEAEYIRIKVDTENYRERRKETLENLAKNIAFKVKRTRRSFALEAMNPYERRIIHSALQNDRYVETYSEGSEPFRHVVVKIRDDAPMDRERRYDHNRKGRR